MRTFQNVSQILGYGSISCYESKLSYQKLVVLQNLAMDYIFFSLFFSKK